MSKKFCVGDDVKELIENIIAKNNLNPVVEVKYTPGSEVGDGYASQTIAVTITNRKQTLDLFLKSALKIKSTESLPIDKFYANEIYFYDVVYPAYQKFSRERGDEIGFRNTPKCYGTLKKNIVALENLKKKGFTLVDRGQVINDRHVKLVLKTFAQFHAVSFAFKDQRKESYEKLAADTFDVLSSKGGETSFMQIMRGTIKDFIKKLDPIDDRDILDKCDAEKLVDCVCSADRNLNEYSILTQGDCWCNNMMFLYEDGDVAKPVDMVLIDWQLLRPASPVFDISYFYLTVAAASEEILAKTDDYLKFYHHELSERIRRLGSDPEVLYPLRILLDEWKRHCRFGFAMATMIIKVMLSAKEEAFNLENIDFNDAEQLENLYPKFENEEEFMRRMRVLAKFMIRNDYL